MKLDSLLTIDSTALLRYMQLGVSIAPHSNGRWDIRLVKLIPAAAQL
jgi:hypothetical protein